MDIWNKEERKVICVSNKPHQTFDLENASLLTIGEEYTVVKIDVHSWHTLVRVREFPDQWFNSVLFEELDEFEEEENDEQ